MPNILIDNTPHQFQFRDGNQLSEGMANFANALIQAPLAAERIRQAKEQQDLAELWRQREYENRLQQQTQAAKWHMQGRRDALDQRAIAQENWQKQFDEMQSYRDTQEAAMIANAWGKTAHGIASLFHGKPGAKGAAGDPKIHWVKRHDPKTGAVIGEDPYVVVNGRLIPMPMGDAPVGGGAGEGLPTPKKKEDSGSPILGAAATALGVGGAGFGAWKAGQWMKNKFWPQAAAPAANAATQAAKGAAPVAQQVAQGASPVSQGAQSLLQRWNAAMAAPRQLPLAAANNTSTLSQVRNIPGMGPVAPAAQQGGRIAQLAAGAGNLGRAFAPAAILGGGAYIANGGYDTVTNDLAPSEGDAHQVLMDYASGNKNIDPSWVTRLSSSMTTKPEWMGGAWNGESTEQQMYRLKDQNVNAIVMALHGYIPEGPTKASLIQSIKQDLYDDPTMAIRGIQKLLPAFNQTGDARGGPQGGPEAWMTQPR